MFSGPENQHLSLEANVGCDGSPPLGVEDIYICQYPSSYIGKEGKSRSEQLIGATQYKEKSKSGPATQTVGSAVVAQTLILIMCEGITEI